MIEVSKDRTSTADYRMTGATGAETIQKTRENQKIQKSMGNDKSIRRF